MRYYRMSPVRCHRVLTALVLVSAALLTFGSSSSSRTVSRLGEAGVCPLVAMLPFTNSGKDFTDYLGTSRPSAAFTHMAAMLLAVEDFNARSPIVVPELGGPFYQECPASFPSLKLSDTQGAATVVSNFLVDEITAGRVPCAAIGPWNNEAALEAGGICNGLNLPLVSHGATDNRLSAPRRYPLVARTMVNLHAHGEAVVDFIKSKGRSDFVGVITTTHEYGQYWHQVVYNAAHESNPPVTLKQQTFNPKEEQFVPNSVRWAMMELQKTTYRTILVALNDPANYLNLVADAAEEFGMNGDDYMYVFSEIFDLDFLASQTNENVTKIVNGSAVVRPIDNFLYLDQGQDRFLQRWRNADSTILQKLNAINPIPKHHPGYYQPDDDFFLAQNPSWGAGFAYDAVMAIGMGACRTLLMTKQDKSFCHFDGIVESQFTGSTGKVHFGEGPRFPGNRVRDSVAYGAFNIRNKQNGENGMEAVLTDILKPNKWLQMAWEQVEGENFLYADGTTKPPKLLRDIPEQNYLNARVRVLGLFMMSLSVALSFASTLFVYHAQNSQVIQASQPPFLYALCFGAVCMALSIFPISFDEGSGWNDHQLDFACISFPWLLSLGYIIIYCALFSKLWRVNRVLQFSRVKVEMSQVVWPFFLLVLGTMVVLAVWTAIDAFEWERNVTDYFSGESYGRCNSQHSLKFLSFLVVLMITSTIMTFGMAWKTKDVQGVFAESSWIFYTIFLQIQVLLVGIPILVILQSASADATYLGRVMVIWTFPVSTVGLIIGPKFVTLYVSKKPPNNRRRERFQSNEDVTDIRFGPSAQRNDISSLNSMTETIDAGTLTSISRLSAPIDSQTEQNIINSEPEAFSESEKIIHSRTGESEYDEQKNY